MVTYSEGIYLVMALRALLRIKIIQTLLETFANITVHTILK